MTRLRLEYCTFMWYVGKPTGSGDLNPEKPC